MATRSLLLLLFVLAVALAGVQSRASAPSQAGSQPALQTICPWLTTGTAAKVLGGDVDVTSTGANAVEGSCRFVRRDAAMVSLEIAVGKSVLPVCPAGSVSLVGIGNEAARCKVSAAHGGMAEMLSGRVRDLRFSLVLRGQERDLKNPSDPQNDALEKLAEQVAGNLF
jgi:hypothetical protein